MKQYVRVVSREFAMLFVSQWDRCMTVRLARRGVCVPVGPLRDRASRQVVASAIVDKYIGESARVIREMFSFARDHQPCVLPRA